MPPRTLTLRELNRTHLHRQHLLERSQMSVGDMLSTLVGLQAQEVKDPYLGLWSRLESFAHEDLANMLLDHTAVRGTLMRGTIHLVTAEDYPFLFQSTYSLHVRGVNSAASAHWMPREHHAAIAAKSHELLSDQSLTSLQIGEALHADWPDFAPSSLARVVRFLLPLIQTPPRGVWGTKISSRPSWTLPDQWLGIDVPREQATAYEMIRRYLRAFGPASQADMIAWSGVTNPKTSLAEMTDELTTYLKEDGDILYDTVGLEILSEDTAAPIRFMPGFDNALLGFKDRRRIISDEARALIGTPNGMFASTFTVDGFVAGIWRIHDEALELAAFSKLSKRQQQEVEREAKRLAPFWTGEQLPVRWTEVWKLPGKHPR
ncbi:MAG: winged helix DNA-binding domain-containing protein [Thermomicrobiales bacterium]|nr:winged helix DNA-binding domain-containing protein [Thermomicrobiales bacterium]